LQVNAIAPAVPVIEARCRLLDRPRIVAARESAGDAAKIPISWGQVTRFRFKKPLNF
jgi:hypothetical protein